MTSGSDVFDRIDNSLVSGYLDTDSYMAKVSGSGMTNSKALSVLAEIERKLAGMSLVHCCRAKAKVFRV